MSAPVVRLQLPAGTVFMAAFDGAVSQYAARRGFGDEGAAFMAVSAHAAQAVSTAEPSSIEFTATEENGFVETTVRAVDPSGSIAVAAARQLMDQDRLLCDSLQVESTTVRFAVALN